MARIGRLFSNSPVFAFILLLFFGVIALEAFPDFFSEGSISISLPFSRMSLFVAIAIVLVIDVMFFHFSRIVLSIFILISCTLLFGNVLVGLTIALVHYLLLGAFGKPRSRYSTRVRRLSRPRRLRR